MATTAPLPQRCSRRPVRSETTITQLQTSREGVVGSIANPFFGGEGGGGGGCPFQELHPIHTYVSAENGCCRVYCLSTHMYLQTMVVVEYCFKTLREPSRPKGWPSSPKFCKMLQRWCFPFKNIQSVCEV